MTTEEFIRHPSIQREFARFRQLGGHVTIEGSKVIFDAAKTISAATATACVQRIEDLDPVRRLKITVRNEA